MVAPMVQPPFATQILNLKYPLGTGNYGSLQRGYMQWDTSNLPTGYDSAAQVNFLYNPSTVTASYSLVPDTSVQAAMLFPSSNSTTDLRVPLSQTVEWSLLFDRTFELWGAYSSSDGVSIQQQIQENSGTNNPSAIGVMADINAMMQFTGMFASFYSGTTATQQANAGGAIASSLFNQQGIMMPVYSYVWFGSNTLSYYGYVSEWDVTITHWTQYMIPMRCVINVDFTMLPLPTSTPSNPSSNTDYSLSSISTNLALLAPVASAAQPGVSS